MSAQKLEVIRTSTASVLPLRFAELKAEYADSRYILTPVSVVLDEGEWVLFVHIEASHKARFDDEKEDEEATGDSS